MTTKCLTTWKTLSVIAWAITFHTCLYAQPTIKILATDPTALEGTSTGAFTLVRNGNTNADLAVNLDIAGSAVNGVDYSPIASQVTIPAGFLAIDIPVQPLINTTVRGNKTVVLTLQSNAAYRVVGRGCATVKIVDDLFDVPPPTVALTSPAEGSVFTSPATVTLSADVTGELAIQRVGFYVNDKLVGTVTNSPYSLVWNSDKAGKYTFFARAVDEFDKSGVSPDVHATVSATPVVNLVSWYGNDVFAGQQIPLEAQIGDANEQIQSVSFYVNKKLVGTLTSAPFVYLWSDDKAGTFTVQAIATDKATGKTGNSNKLTINVSPFWGGGN